MTTLQPILNDILNTTSYIADLKFAEASNGLPDYLLTAQFHVNQPLVRHAEPHECKLFTTADSTSLVSSIDPITPRQLRNKSRPNIEKLLAAANTLNQICQLSDIQEHIQTLAQMHEEKNINIDYLESTLAKQQNELAALLRATRVVPRLPTADNTNKIAKDIDHEMSEVKALEMQLREKEKMSDTLDEQIYEQRQLLDQEEEMDDVMKVLDDMDCEGDEDLAALQKEVLAKKRQLQEYDTVLETLNQDSYDTNYTQILASIGMATPRKSGDKRPRDVFQSIKSKWERLQKSATEDSSYSEDLNQRLADVMENVSIVLEEVVSDVEELQAIDANIDIIRQVNAILVDTIASYGDTPNADASIISTTSTIGSLISASTLSSTNQSIRPTSQTILAATVLQIIRDTGGEIPFADLKTRVGAAAKALGLAEQQGTSAVYMLVASHLVVIDRSSKANLVKIV